ncbi:hypothetical protein PENSPDRAFT_645280 [Peniophora sp. CONT]|nr:hypothetical protein PENSPDRAFT_645280 [Peniophora sp. CONT]
MDSPTVKALPAHEQSQKTSSHTPSNARVAAQLPDDIICQFYYILAKDFAPWAPRRTQVSTRTYGGPPGRLGWMNLTHVCRTWRRVGLEMSTLWAPIVCDFPPNIPEIAERARDTPLTFVLNQYDSNRVHWSIDDVSKVISRVRTYADTPDYRGKSWNALLAGRRLPLLRHLVLYTNGRNFYDEPDMGPLDAPALCVLQTDFPRQVIAPALSSLTLYGGLWRWEDCLKFIIQFPLLEELHVPALCDQEESEDEYDDESDDESDNESDDGSFDEPDDSGASDESDEESTPSSPSEPDFEPSRVPLPHLKLLALEHFDSNANQLLHHLDYPQDVELRVAHFNEDEVERLMSRSDWDYAPHDALIIEDAYQKYSLQFGVKLIFSEYKPEPGRRTQSVVEGIFSYDVPDTLDAVPDNAVSKITTFGFSHNCHCPSWAGCRGTMGGVDPELLATSLARFTGVNRLLIHNQDDASPIFEALRVIEPSIQPAFPALKSLMIVLVHEVGQAWWHELRTLLAERKSAGHAITLMVVRGKGTLYSACPGHYKFSERDGESPPRSDHSGEVRELNADDMYAACRNSRRITLESESEFVDEIGDDREELGNYESRCYGP